MGLESITRFIEISFPVSFRTRPTQQHAKFDPRVSPLCPSCLMEPENNIHLADVPPSELLGGRPWDIEEEKK